MLQFFPHGTHQTLAHGNYTVLHVPPAMLCGTTLSNPQRAQRYRERVGELTKLFVPPDRLQKRVDELHQRLRPVLADMGENYAKQFDEQVKILKGRLAARARYLQKQSETPGARPSPLSRAACTD